MRVVAAEAGDDHLAARLLAVRLADEQDVGRVGTHTPPCPTAMPEGMFSPSAKTVNLSARPSPSVSSSTFTRSRPGPAGLRGYSRLSVIQILPALVERHRDRVDDVRLAGDQLDRNPSGTVIFAWASTGE